MTLQIGTTHENRSRRLSDTLGGVPDLGSGGHLQMVRRRYAATAALCSARAIFRSVPRVLYVVHAQKRAALGRNV